MPKKTQITLKTAAVLPFVMIFILTITVIWGVQKNNYEEMLVDVSGKQLTTLTDSVNLELHRFLNAPFQASLSLSHSIGFHRLYEPNNTRSIEQYLLSSFHNLYGTLPQLDAMGFGGENAEYVGFRKESNNRLTLMVQDARTNGKLVIYQGQTISEDIRSVFEDYDPRIRPWYKPVTQSLTPIWSSIYANADERQEITLSALTPVFDNQTFKGVMVADVKINTFNTFLKQQQQKNNALIYIVDKNKRLVAQSVDGQLISLGTTASPKGERLLASESSNPIIKANADYFNNHNFEQKNKVQSYTLTIADDRYFNHLTSYTDEYGLQLYIGVAIAESELLGKLAENQQKSWLLGSIACLIGIAAGILAFNHIVAPITETVTAAKRLAKGDWDSYVPQPGRIYETTMLVNAFNEMANNLKASFQALRSQLLYDSLTNQYSREGLVETCDKLPILNGSLLLIGINKFRDINDSLGHSQGDQLLIIISKRLQSIFVGEYQYYLARIGGDEFAIYFLHQPKGETIQQAAKQILNAFTMPFVINHESVIVSVSIGIVDSHQETNMTLWLRNGSIALSNAKQDVTNISYYRPEMASISRNKTVMQVKIKDGLEKHQFVPFYQSIIDIKTGKVVGAEALARWLSPTDGLISPLDFIPIAEESDLIRAIGEQILFQACNDTVRGIKEGKWDKTFHMHVNLSVNQLSQPDFIATLQRALTQSGLNPNNLTLEITESRIVDNNPITIQNMQAIRDLGVDIAIDDFGTGYSSLAYLYKLPFNCVKIDRTFINNLKAEELDTSVVASIINMTQGMKVSLIAEGIETDEQSKMLAELNCPLGQGFLYNKPIPYEKWPVA